MADEYSSSTGRELKRLPSDPPSADVLPFPPRDRGRIRKRRSPLAMGRCSFSLLDNAGEDIPVNVADIRAARDEPHVDDSRLALRLALAIFATLSPEGKDSIRRVARTCARHEDGALGNESRALYRLLTGERLPC